MFQIIKSKLIFYCYWIINLVSQEELWLPVENNKSKSINHQTIRNWSIIDLMDEAEKALTSLNICRNVTVSNQSNYLSKEYIGVDFKLIGPYIPPVELSAKTQKEYLSKLESVNVYRQIPNYCLVGISLDTERSDFSNYIYVGCNRMSSLPHGVRARGDGWIYEVSWIYVFKKSRPQHLVSYCSVAKDGTVTLCEQMYEKWCSVGRGKYKDFVKHNYWKVFDVMEIARSENVREGLINSDVKAFTTKEAICLAFNDFLEGNLNFIVKVSDHRGIVNFGIDLREAKTLFRSRVKVKTESGRTKPIVHWVKAHNRVTGSNVRTHMRGLTKFKWQNKDVMIYLPGKKVPLFDDFHNLAVPKITSDWSFFQKPMKSKQITVPETKEIIDVEFLPDSYQSNGKYYNVLAHP